MLLLLPLTILISQGLVGSAYVVVEENGGYYSTWRSNPMQNQWQMFPDSYMSFMQNLNPFSWGRPQQSIQEQNREMKTISMRQMALYKMVKCIIEENERNACKTMLDKAMMLFEEPEIVVEAIQKPIIIQWQVKPVEAPPAIVQVKPVENTPVVEEKPVEVALTAQQVIGADVAMEVKPIEVQPSVPAMEAVVPLSVQPEPTPVESANQISPLEVANPTSDVMPENVDPVVLETKPESEVVELQEKSGEAVPTLLQATMKTEPVLVDEKSMKNEPMSTQENLMKAEPVMEQEKPTNVERMLPQEKSLKTEPVETEVLRVEVVDVESSQQVKGIEAESVAQ